MDESRLIFDPDKLRRASRQAAIISGVGFLIVFLAFAAGIFRLQGLSRRIGEGQRELATVEEDCTRANSELSNVQIDLKLAEINLTNVRTDSMIAEIELASLEKQIGALRRETKELREGGKDAPIAVIKPRASCEKLSPEEMAKHEAKYQFWLWIEAPEEVKNAIEKVTYYMNHWTFSKPLFEGTDPNDNFRAGYPGWGSLSNVIVTVFMKDQSTIELDFNQTEAINESRSTPSTP